MQNEKVAPDKLISEMKAALNEPDADMLYTRAIQVSDQLKVGESNYLNEIGDVELKEFPALLLKAADRLEHESSHPLNAMRVYMRAYHLAPMGGDDEKSATDGVIRNLDKATDDDFCTGLVIEGAPYNQRKFWSLEDALFEGSGKSRKSVMDELVAPRFVKLLETSFPGDVAEYGSHCMSALRWAHLGAEGVWEGALSTFILGSLDKLDPGHRDEFLSQGIDHLYTNEERTKSDPLSSALAKKFAESYFENLKEMPKEDRIRSLDSAVSHWRGPNRTQALRELWKQEKSVATALKIVQEAIRPTPTAKAGPAPQYDIK